jgi:DNA-binding PadR family transcriptional regulator
MALDVRILCLGALSQADASGYELQKAFKDGPFGHFVEASYGSIYPALTRLTDEGLVTFSEHTQEGRPDKKVYSILDAGKASLVAAISDMPQTDKFRSEFLFFMTFAELMEETQIMRLIDERIAIFEDNKARLDETGNDVSTLGQKFVQGYGRAMVEASLKYLRENRALVEETARGKNRPPLKDTVKVNQS